MDQRAAPVAMATPASTARRFLAQSSMIRPIMASLRLPARRVRRATRVRERGERLQRAAHPAFGVDEEVGCGHHRFALFAGLQQLNPATGTRAHPNGARIEGALAE